MPTIKIQENTSDRIESFFRANLFASVGDKERIIKEATWDLKICVVLDALDGAFRRIVELEEQSKKINELGN